MHFNNIREPYSVQGRVLCTLDAPTLYQTKQVSSVWQDCKAASSVGGQEQLPNRTCFNLKSLKPILPYVYLMNVIDDGVDFEIRLMGTGLTALVGQDYTGCRISEIEGAEWCGKMYRQALLRPVPTFWQSEMGSLDHSVHIEVAAFPVWDQVAKSKILLLTFGIKRAEMHDANVCNYLTDPNIFS